MTLSSLSMLLPEMKYWIRFEIFAALVLLLWLLGQLTFLGWLSDLASHFQLQYFLAFSLLLFFALWQRKWRCLPFLIVGLIISGFAISPYLPLITTDSSSSHQPVLRVMQANVFFKSHAYSRVIDAIQKYDPDILSLQEVDSAWLVAIQPALKKYPYHIERVQPSRVFGVSLYSKFPLKKPQIRYYEDVARPNLLAEIEFDGRTVGLATMHPYSPGNPNRYHWRNKQLSLFAQNRHTLNENLIVIGDLNDSPFSSSFKTFLKQTKLKNTRVGRGFYPTWPALVPLLWIPIDHILVSPAFKVNFFQTGPLIGSDHLPIVVDLTFNAKK